MHEVLLLGTGALLGAAITLLFAYMAPGDPYSFFQSYSEIEKEKAEILGDWRPIALFGAIFGVMVAITFL